ncbi:MAG: hypothetical protein FJX15_13115 [Alphaproteobacteria bacterium]|nr:hypothetical protein [Alphaproteobacteria bacterium]
MIEALGLAATTDRIDALCEEISDAICRYCRVPEDGVKAPTLLIETLVETLARSTKLEIGAFPYPASQPDFKGLPLSRYPIQTITSIVEDGVTLSVSNYAIDKAKGYLNRRLNGKDVYWTADEIVVTYSAGRVMTQELGLRSAAINAVREQYFSDRRDPSLRSVNVEGIGRRDYQIGGASGVSTSAAMQPFTPSVLAALEPYRYPMQ